MKIISLIEAHEMKRRWAVGEIKSEFCLNRNPTWQEETLLLLESSNLHEQVKGIERYRDNLTYPKKQLFDSMPHDTRWSLVTLPLIEQELEKLRTIHDRNWKKYTAGTYLLCKAVTYLTEHPEEDSRISFIISNLPDKKIEMRGITLLANKEEGPYEIKEGNGRLGAVYYHCILNSVKLFENDEIEVALGLHRTN
jgi:hypothetical protein